MSLPQHHWHFEPAPAFLWGLPWAPWDIKQQSCPWTPTSKDAGLRNHGRNVSRHCQSSAEGKGGQNKSPLIENHHSGVLYPQTKGYSSVLESMKAPSGDGLRGEDCSFAVSAGLCALSLHLHPVGLKGTWIRHHLMILPTLKPCDALTTWK